jgi:hypothetical protein
MDAATSTGTTQRARDFSIRAATPEERAWFSARLGFPLTGLARGIAAVGADGRIRAMFVFDLWSHNAAEAHILVESPIALRPLMRAAARWFFLEQGKGVLMGRVRASNTKAMRLDKHLGFREAYRIRDGAKQGEDMLLVEMRRETCKWLKEAHHG